LRLLPLCARPFPYTTLFRSPRSGSCLCPRSSGPVPDASVPYCIDNCTWYRSRMAQARKRPTVSLTLDPEVRAAAQEVLKELPFRMSLSELIDTLLSEFVRTTWPVLRKVAGAPAADRLAVLQAFTVESVGRLMQ